LRITGLRKTVRNMKRYREIFNVLLKYGFEDVLDRFKLEVYTRTGKKIIFRERGEKLIQMSRPERIRLALEELGPTFIKLGQMLSTRPDLIPVEFTEEFRKLQDEIPPFPYQKAKEIIESEFDESIDNLFPTFKKIPEAAASMAQVHRAVTKSGEQVAVKIQRPGINSIIRSDMEILSDLANLIARRLPEDNFYDPVEIVGEFRMWINRELDFFQEGRNIDRFRRNFKNDETIYIPKVYWDLCSSKVLTMEHIDGIRVLDLERLEQAGLDRKTIAVNGANLVLRQIFEHGFFHGDPHPGNIFVLENNVIAPLDFGLVGRLDEELIEQLGDLLSGIVHKNIDRIVRVFLNIGVVQDEIDTRNLKLDIGEFIDKYYQIPLYQLDMQHIINEAMEIVSRHHIRLPRDLYLMGKALAIMEGIGEILDPEFDMMSLATPYVQKIMVEKLNPRRLAKDGLRFIEDSKDLLEALPENIKQILFKIRKGKLGINLHHQGLEQLIKELDKSTNRLSFSLIIAALIIASSLIIQLNKGPLIFGLSAFGLIGYVIAAFLGLWLVIAIMRSGRL